MCQTLQYSLSKFPPETWCARLKITGLLHLLVLFRMLWSVTKYPTKKPSKRRSKETVSSSPLKIHKSHVTTSRTFTTCMTQLLELGYLSPLPNDVLPEQSDSEGENDSARNYTTESELVYDFENFPQLAGFVRKTLRKYLLRTTSLLNLIHTRCLQNFIDSAFDMARDMIITPKR